MRREEQDRQKLFNRRMIVMGGLQSSLMAVLFGRLYYLSVVEAEKYSMLAEENRIDLRLLAPERGLITDRTGVLLARNRQNYRVVLVPEQASRGRTSRRSELLAHVEQTLNTLSKLIPLSDHNRKRVLREVARNRSFMPITISENLTWEQFARVNVNAHDIPGITPEVGESRFYPHSDTFSHIVGYVSAVSEQDLETETDPVLELPGFRIGKLGVERVFESDLRGIAGTSRVEVNAVGRVIREVQRDSGTSGKNLTLSLDANLQRFAQNRLAEETGSVVVMDVKTGELIISCSTPGYDPNQFVIGLSNEAWRELNEDIHTPMINKVVTGFYSPGSTFKMVVALAGLEAGLIRPDEKIYCSGHTDVGSHRFHCWKRHGHGWMDLHNSIKQSCDVYYYEMSKRIGIDRIAAMAKRFGLGVKPDIPMTAVREGLMPTKDWKRNVLGEPWHMGETLNASIGQGQVTITPIQLAIMTASMANGKNLLTPVLVKAWGGEPAANPNLDTPQPLGIKPEHMALMHQAMSGVMNEPGGTARRSAIPMSEGGLAGKTGTVQVRRITRAERETGVRKNEDKPWEERDHALFVGYGPVENPKYAIAVVVEHGGSGSKAAAPVASDILREVMRRDPSAVDTLPTPLSVDELAQAQGDVDQDQEE